MDTNPSPAAIPAISALIGAVITALTAWFIAGRTSRSTAQMSFRDAILLRLQTVEEQNEKCKQQHDECREKNVELERKLITVERKVAKLEYADE